MRDSPRVKAVTALSASHISAGLTGQWRAWNRGTTEYHTAPSLVSRCRLMGSWKVKMKKWFPLHASLSLIFSLRHSAVADRCQRFCRSLPSSLQLCHFKTVQSESRGEGGRGGGHKNATVISVRRSLRQYFWRCTGVSCLLKIEELTSQLLRQTWRLNTTDSVWSF